LTTPPDSYEIGTATTDEDIELHVDFVGKYMLHDELQPPAVTLSWQEFDDEDELIGLWQSDLTPDAAERLSSLLAEAADKARKLRAEE
jgi:hypothetical protein